MVGTPSCAPRHPSRARRSMVVWRGYRRGIGPEDLDRRVSGCFAMPVAHALLEAGTVAAAHKAGVGVALLAHSWRNQLEPGDERRGGTFAALPYHRPGRLDPDGQPLAGAHAERYALAHVEAEIGAGASLLSTPGHVLENECAGGRRGELLLARLCAQELAARGRVPGPAAGQSGARELYATIMLRGAHAVHPRVTDWLVRAYAELEGIAGYWLVAVNCTGSARQVGAFASLALRLEAASARPVLCAGVGHCHLALLASGVAATCAGHHGMSFAYPPQALPEPPEDPEEEPTGLGVHVYHPAALGNVGKLGAEGEEARAAIFANHPCDCGAHPSRTPPREHAQKLAHNLACETADARSLVEPAPAVAEARMAARAERAERVRALIGVGELKRGFYGPALAAAALRGRDAAGAERG